MQLYDKIARTYEGEPAVFPQLGIAHILGMHHLMSRYAGICTACIITCIGPMGCLLVQIEVFSLIAESDSRISGQNLDAAMQMHQQLHRTHGHGERCVRVGHKRANPTVHCMCVCVCIRKRKGSRVSLTESSCHTPSHTHTKAHYILT